MQLMNIAYPICSLHPSHLLRKFLHFLPICELDWFWSFEWSAGHAHDETNHECIKFSIDRVVEFSSEYSGELWLPLDFREKLTSIWVGLRSRFLWLACDEIDREERIFLGGEKLCIFLYEFADERMMVAIADRRTDDHGIIRSDIDVTRVDRIEKNIVSLLRQDVTDIFGDFFRVAVSSSVDDECRVSHREQKNSRRSF